MNQHDRDTREQDTPASGGGYPCRAVAAYAIVTMAIASLDLGAAVLVHASRLAGRLADWLMPGATIPRPLSGSVAGRPKLVSVTPTTQLDTDGDDGKRDTSKASARANVERDESS